MRLTVKHMQRRARLAARWQKTEVTAAAAALTMVLLVLLAFFAADSHAQNQKNNKKDPQATGTVSPVTLPDPQAIDRAISEMLGAWQVGDVEAMHKYYADDVTVVSGVWEQPLFGWDNYVRAYQAQRSRSEGGRLERTNTYTKLMGETAWVTYQWEYIGQVDGQSMNAFGHTTLLMQKRAANWVIVLNHTSSVPTAAQSGAAPASASSAR